MLDSTIDISPERLADLQRQAGKILTRILYDGAAPEMLRKFLEANGLDARIDGHVRIALHGAPLPLTERNEYAAAIPTKWRVFIAALAEKFPPGKLPGERKLAEILGVRVTVIRQAIKHNEARKRWYCIIANLRDFEPKPARPPRQRRSPVPDDCSAPLPNGPKVPPCGATAS